MIIDAHHHFWRYTPEEYGWIGDDMSALRRDFLPHDLAAELNCAGVSGAISVQARQTLNETHWLLELARAQPIIRGVVGWAPLTSEKIESELESLSQDRKLRGIRHVLQDEPDDHYMLREDFNRGISLLGRFDLRYDVLIFERQLPQVIQLVDRHPQQVFILDHIAKPRIKQSQIEPWRTNLIELARRPNVYCKISGMVTEAHWSAWTIQQLQPYFDAALHAFGPGRLMFGSDWPVCLIASSYDRWRETVRQWSAPLSNHEQERLFAATAIQAYGLEPQ